ncbi:unnamed protein product [Orchesella dallaii]|uniref:Uncharacterized protein n=1 Tax=Orchesella dallaii TaxID=48710 RepID=A0ABP1R999_9HEXA
MTKLSSNTRRKSVRFRAYMNGPPGLSEFVEKCQDFSGETPIVLVISTFDIELTFRKIEDNTDAPINIVTEEESTGKWSEAENSIAICKSVRKPKDFLKKYFEMVDTDNDDEKNEDCPISRKLVILTEENYQDVLRDVGNMVKEGLFESNCIQLENDTISWVDLSESMKQNVLQRKIILQKNETTLKDLSKTNDGFEDALTKLCGPLLIELINDNCPIILADEIPPVNQDQRQVYVGRKISPRNQISSKIFQSSGKDLFLFTGIQKEQLVSKYVTRGKTYSTGDVAQPVDGKLPVLASNRDALKFRILSGKKGFNEISEKTSRAVHYLHHNDEIFTWVKSKGSLATIQDAVDGSTSMFDENDSDFLQKFESNQVTIISGEGGTGKTKFLENIGRKLQHVYSNDLVLNISTFEEEILKEIIKKNAGKRIHFLLDGFDQIEHCNVKIAMKCLKRMRQQFDYSIRVWVTVRPHLLKLLENFLTSLNYSYELQPLDTTQQTQFIISYSGPDGTNPEEYIKTCNQLTNEKGWDLFRLPEQCRLIADVFQDLSVQQQKDAPDRTENKLNEDYLFAEIYGLHTNNIEKKYRESNSDGALSKDDLQYQIMFEAIQKLFPGWTSPFQKLLKKQDFITGLMDSNSAAFLVSRFIIKMILEESSNALREDKHEFLFTEFLWNQLACVGVRKKFGDHALFLYEFKHPVIAHLLNDMIPSIRHVDQHIIESLQETTTSYRLKQLAIACCYNNFANLLQFILARRPFEEHDYNVFDENLLFVAVSNTNVELFGNLLGKYVEHRGNVVIRDISIRPGVSLLQAAVARGDIAIVNYLLGPHDFEELVRIGKSKSCQGLLHLTVSNSFLNQPKVIEQKREILRQLHSLNGGLIFWLGMS